jgi:hypothetical protein
MKTKPVLFFANALAKQLGITGDTILRLYRDEAIDAEIHEGRLIRFDLEKVRTALAKRAKRNREPPFPLPRPAPQCILRLR